VLAVVRKSETTIILRRARDFFENALQLFDRGKFDLAAFNLEQALQLLLKYKLLIEIGDYPKTHSLRRLFRILIDVLNDEALKDFFLKNIDTTGNLESAYIASRYLPVEFEKKEVENMIKLVKNSFRLLVKGEKTENTLDHQ